MAWEVVGRLSPICSARMFRDTTFREKRNDDEFDGSRVGENVKGTPLRETFCRRSTAENITAEAFVRFRKPLFGSALASPVCITVIPSFVSSYQPCYSSQASHLT